MSRLIRCECFHPAGLHVWSGCQVQLTDKRGQRRCACTLTAEEIVARKQVQADIFDDALPVRRSSRQPIGV